MLADLQLAEIIDVHGELMDILGSFSYKIKCQANGLAGPDRGQIRQFVGDVLNGFGELHHGDILTCRRHQFMSAARSAFPG